MNLIFPNLQYLEGKTLSQLFTVQFLSFLRDIKGIEIKNVNLIDMKAEITEDINIDKIFNEYLTNVFKESLEIYHYTIKMLRRGKVQREDYFKKIAEDEIIKKIFGPEECIFIDRDEMNFAWHIAKLSQIQKNIGQYRSVQTMEETGEVCSVCGLIRNGDHDITEAISLVSDKCWRPLGSYQQLKGCKRCAFTLGLLGNIILLWRINIIGKAGKTRYVFIPKFKITDRSNPEIIDEINEYLNLLKLFRIKTIGSTAIDHIFNSFRAEPIIAKLVNDQLFDLAIYTQSATGQGGYVTENVIHSEKIRKIAEFAVFTNKYLPGMNLYANGNAKTGNFRILSDVAYLWTTRGKSHALCELFTRKSMNFDVVIKMLGGAGSMKIEYFKNPELIKEMNTYEWDNPLVRISTFFVAERANNFSKEGKKSDQAINTPMALFNSIPENAKNKTIRKFLEEITSKGGSYILNQISEPEEFLTEFSTALRSCTVAQLKELVRYMRMFANTYMFKPQEQKIEVFTDTISKLGYEIKKGA